MFFDFMLLAPNVQFWAPEMLRAARIEPIRIQCEPSNLRRIGTHIAVNARLPFGFGLCGTPALKRMLEHLLATKSPHPSIEAGTIFGANAKHILDQRECRCSRRLLKILQGRSWRQPCHHRYRTLSNPRPFKQPY
jgi:hypothetical protein